MAGSVTSKWDGSMSWLCQHQKVAREVLQTQDAVFANRPANVAIVYLTYDRADMAFANYGPFWRQTRKICVMKLFSRRRAESWASVRDEVGFTIRQVMEKTGVPVNIGEQVFALTRSITYNAAFGSSSSEGQEEFMEILQEFSKLFGAFNVADFFPWLGWVNARDFNKRLAKARNSLDGENASKNDFDESKSTVKFNKDHIKALIMDVMFGGTETVASAIEWAIAELMKSPEDLKKVQQELIDVVGLNRAVHESDLEKAYLSQMCNERNPTSPPSDSSPPPRNS
ncbi:hypothetical protein OIU77_029025 [Salix suchowensis]|uniref:Ferulate 5-hydroxylase n=1 Tax=Salix suchowensis TaxID=1278906 RepID=A0ABQ9BLB2_9ROSI|nr:hypothetical protein OIU77_029025 [Salix suchowensis]